MAQDVTHPELEPDPDELPLEWWSDDELADLVETWKKMLPE